NRLRRGHEEIRSRDRLRFGGRVVPACAKASVPDVDRVVDDGLRSGRAVERGEQSRMRRLDQTEIRRNTALVLRVGHVSYPHVGGIGAPSARPPEDREGVGPVEREAAAAEFGGELGGTAPAAGILRRDQGQDERLTPDLSAQPREGYRPQP